MNSKDNDKTIVVGFVLDLIYSIQSDKGDKFVVSDEALVGRGQDCEVLIDDKKISRNHAKLKLVSGRLEEQEVKKSEAEAVPSSWIEESGLSEGTRMLDMSELEALRAGSKEVKQNDSDVTRLHCFVDGKEEEIVELPITDFDQASGWEMGRDSTCDIVFDHPSVSNRHAQIIHQNGRWKIVNLVSTNGIQINGQKRLSTYLSNGGKVDMGSVNLVIKIPKSQAKNAKKSVQKSSNSNKNMLVLVC